MSKWVLAYGTGGKTAADGSTVPSEIGGSRTIKASEGEHDGAALTQEQKLARLETENSRLRAPGLGHGRRTCVRVSTHHNVRTCAVAEPPGQETGSGRRASPEVLAPAPP